MNNINVCNHLCGTCPFSNKSMKGFLGGYSIENIRWFLNNSIFFPCHKELSIDLLTTTHCEAIVKNEGVKLCRGFMECMVKSATTPKDLDLAQVRQKVKVNLSDDSMSIFDFIEHHKVDIK